MKITPVSRAACNRRNPRNKCNSRNAPSAYLARKHVDANMRKYLNAALSENTVLAYRADLKHFFAWGGSIPARAERVARYIAHYASTLSLSTLSRRLVAIGRAHVDRGFNSPTNSPLVRAMLQGVRRSSDRAIRQVAPLQKSDLLKMVRGLTDVRGMRDSALLLLGFAGAFRRSELVSLDVDDVRFSDEGMLVRLRRSKTDQAGQGRVIAIPRVRGRCCPTQMLQDWLRASAISDGAIFRQINRYGQVLPKRLSASSVALIIKQRAQAAGLDPTRLSGHSLRAGFATNAAKQGASLSSIREQTGHKSDAMLQRYIRDSRLFAENPNLKIW